MKRNGLFITAIAVAAIAAMGAAPASATVSSSSITSPADPTFDDADFGIVTTAIPNVPIHVSGTTDALSTAGDLVDIVCVSNIGTAQESVSPIADDVVVDGGHNFSATGDAASISNGPCRLLALPDEPFHLPLVDTANFTGPDYYLGGSAQQQLPTGPNAGQTFLYLQNGYTEETQLSTGGLSNVLAAAAVDPANDQLTGLVGLSFGVVGDAAEVDGQPLSATASVALHPASPGFLGITGIVHTVHSSQSGSGFSLHSASTDSPVTCVPDPATCSSVIDSGLRANVTVDGSDGGHTVTVRQKWLNVTNQAKQVQLAFPLIMGNGTSAGSRFPGEGGYQGHATGDVVPVVGAGANTIGVAQSPGSTCATVADSCASFTWSTPPSSLKFIGPSVLTMTFSPRSVPPGCSLDLAFSASVGHPQAAVDGYAAGARSALGALPSGVVCPTPPGPAPVPPGPKCKSKKKKKKHGKKKAAIAKKKKKHKKSKKCKKKKHRKKHHKK